MTLIKKIPVSVLASAIALTLFPAAFAADPEPNASSSSELKPSLGIGVIGGWTGANVDSSDSLQATTLDSSRKFSYGAAFSLDAPLAPALSLGVGAMYVKRDFGVKNSTLDIERKIPTLFVPVELRFWLGNVLNVSGGGFAAFRVGDVEDKLNAGNNTVFSFSHSDRKSPEYGWTVAAGVLFPVSGRTGIAAEARYLRGLSDGASDPIYDEKISDVLVTAGLRFGF